MIRRAGLHGLLHGVVDVEDDALSAVFAVLRSSLRLTMGKVSRM